MSELGWVGKTVRNADGRQGRITDEWDGPGYVALIIAIDGGGRGDVRLNTNGPDAGDAGWSWYCEKYDGGPRWLRLGPKAPAQEAVGCAAG